MGQLGSRKKHTEKNIKSSFGRYRGFFVFIVLIHAYLVHVILIIDNLHTILDLYNSVCLNLSTHNIHVLSDKLSAE